MILREYGLKCCLHIGLPVLMAGNVLFGLKETRFYETYEISMVVINIPDNLP